METVLQMQAITKRFPGVLALDRVNFDLRRGEIHALVGENGAGKSTLMKVLGGVYQPDEGSMLLRGQNVRFSHPADSMKSGVAVVYQEFNLVKTLDVAANLFIGKELQRGLRLDRKAMLSQAQQAMARLGIPDFDCSIRVKYLSVAMQQLVEIGKAIFNKSEILVMDEPTAVLTDKETQSLFRVMRELTSEGVSIIYISHRLEEVTQMADRITVMRDGQYIETIDNAQRNTSKDRMVAAMVGRELVDYFPAKQNAVGTETALEVRGLSKRGLFENVSFSLHRGETLGFSGLVGAGRSEVMKAIFGAIRPDAGEVLLEGKPLSIRSPLDACRAGIALLPEDRKNEGSVLCLSLAANICLAAHEQLSVGGMLLPARMRALVQKSIEDLQIRPADPQRKMSNFSGGNQQKGILAKWLATHPKVMILDEPTRGIDVGAKVEIYHLIHQLTAQGVSVIVVSSELPELIGICDRILVVRNGHLNGEFQRQAFSQDAIMAASVQ